eukprot:gene8888-biopygen9214
MHENVAFLWCLQRLRADSSHLSHPPHHAEPPDRSDLSDRCDGEQKNGQLWSWKWRAPPAAPGMCGSGGKVVFLLRHRARSRGPQQGLAEQTGQTPPPHRPDAAGWQTWATTWAVNHLPPNRGASRKPSPGAGAAAQHDGVPPPTEAAPPRHEGAGSNGGGRTRPGCALHAAKGGAPCMLQKEVRPACCKRRCALHAAKGGAPCMLQKEVRPACCKG